MLKVNKLPELKNISSRLTIFRQTAWKQHFGFGLTPIRVSPDRLPQAGGYNPRQHRQMMVLLRELNRNLRQHNRLLLLRPVLNLLVYGGALLLALWLLQSQLEVLLEALRQALLWPLLQLRELLAEFLQQLTALRNLPRPAAKGLPEGIREMEPQTSPKGARNGRRWWDWLPLPKWGMGLPRWGLAWFPEGPSATLGIQDHPDRELRGLETVMWGFFGFSSKKSPAQKALQKAPSLTPDQIAAWKDLLYHWSRLWGSLEGIGGDPDLLSNPEKLLGRRKCRKLLYTWQKLADPEQFSEVSWADLNDMFTGDGSLEKCRLTSDRLRLTQEQLRELLWPYAAAEAQQTWLNRGETGSVPEERVIDCHHSYCWKLWGPYGGASNDLPHQLGLMYTHDWTLTQIQAQQQSEELNPAEQRAMEQREKVLAESREQQAQADRQQLLEQQQRQEEAQQERLRQEENLRQELLQQVRAERGAQAAREQQQLKSCQTLEQLLRDTTNRLNQVREGLKGAAAGSSERWSLLYEQQLLGRLQAENQLRLEQVRGSQGRANPPTDHQLESWKAEFNLRMEGYADREGQQLEKRLRRQEEAQQERLQRQLEMQESRAREEARAEWRAQQGFLQSSLDRGLEGLERIFQGAFVAPFRLVWSFLAGRDESDRTLFQRGWDWLEGYEAASKKTRFDRSWDWLRGYRQEADGGESTHWSRSWNWLSSSANSFWETTWNWWLKLWQWLCELPGRLLAWLWQFKFMQQLLLFLLLLAFLILLSFLLRLLLQLLALGYHWNGGGYHPYGFPGPGPGPGGAGGGAVVEAGPRSQQAAGELLRESDASRILTKSRQRSRAMQVTEQVSRQALEWVLDRVGGGNHHSELPRAEESPVERPVSPEPVETRTVSRSPSPVSGVSSPVAYGIPKGDLDWALIQPEGESFPLEEWLGGSEKMPGGGGVAEEGQLGGGVEGPQTRV